MKLKYVLFLITFMFVSELSFASPANAVLDFGASLGNIIGLKDCLDGSDETFVLRKVTCVRYTIMWATQKFVVKFALFLEPYIWAYITLTVAFFGVRLTMGEPEMTKKTFLLLIKIGTVIWLGIELGEGLGTPTMIGSDFALSIFDIMGELQQMVTLPLIADQLKDPHCDFSISTAFNALFNSIIWERLDCMLDKIFGLGGGKTFFAASVIGIVSSALFSGTMGIMVFFLGISLLLTILIFAFRAIWIYVSSYVFVGFLLILTPLMAPMILMGVTQQAFWIWIRNIVAGMMQPVMLFAFLTFAIPMMDSVMFDAKNKLSIVSVLGDKNNKTTLEYVRDSHTGKAQKCQWSIPTDQDFYQKTNSPAWLQGPLKNFLNPMMSGQTDLCALFDFNAIDFGVTHFEQMMKIGYAFFVAVFVAWVLKGVMDSLAELSSGIFGAYLGFNSPIENAISSKMGIAQKNMRSNLGGRGGGGASGFIRSMPSAIGAGVRR